VLFASYTDILNNTLHGAGLVSVTFDLTAPRSSPFAARGIMPFLFGSLAMLAVGRAAGEVVIEVRRQFREIPGIMDGTAKPEYGKTVALVTAAAQREMIIPGILPVIAPLVVGFSSGRRRSGRCSSDDCGRLFVALQMTTGGGAWTTPRSTSKRATTGARARTRTLRRSPATTVGDPYKDTAGPAINPMIKVMNIIAILAIPTIALHHVFF